MKTIAAVWLALCAATATAQVPGYGHFAETEHLRFAWNDGAISEEGLAAMKRNGENYYATINDMLGDAPDHKILILIEGPAQRPDGSWAYPRVDSWGRVHLYQFGPSYHDYMGAYAHELVHAMRIQRKPHKDWFFEEGLAEFIALRADEPLRGFPWYGFPVAIAAGQWLAGGEDIPLATLRNKHKATNQTCKAQSYTLRSAFFDYLGKTYGDDAVLNMAKQDKAGAVEDYEKFFGKDFDTLSAEWRKGLLASFAAIEDADAQAARYRNETPIQYMPVCDGSGVARR
ncbi:MAG: hypothetical protein OEN01_06135 [Candidatus Krumholzibacteria bacterium]|nr:hypothetical protein [Candidatus Krumholzibacteria bacterium]